MQVSTPPESFRAATAATPPLPIALPTPAQNPQTPRSAPPGAAHERSAADPPYFHDNEEIFTVADHAALESATKEAYELAIQAMHDKLVQGTVTGYHEVQLPLPRSLQGMRVAKTVEKLVDLNPELQTSNWSSVTADVVGNKLILTTFSAPGLNLLKALKEIKMEHGRKIAVPKINQPNNRYYLDILMPREWELQSQFLGVAVKMFKSTLTVENPNRGKPLGSKRLFRLTMTTVTAPRDVYTEADASVPIREIKLPCGAVAQIIHKWSRLNIFPPPSMANKWQPRRSYAAATGAPGPSNAPRQQHVPAPAPIPRPGSVPSGPPPPAQRSSAHTQITPTGTPASSGVNRAAITPAPTTNRTTNLDAPEIQSTPAMNVNDPPPAHPAQDGNEDVTMADLTTDTPQSVTTPAVNDDTMDTEEEADWSIATGPCAKKARNSTSTPSQNPQSQTNRFSLLAYADLDRLDDVEFTPIAVSTTGKSLKPYYRSAKGKKSRTAQQLAAMKHPQQLRHPAHILKHTPPSRGQYLLATSDEDLAHGRQRLHLQIALLRGARTGHTHGPTRLTQLDDDSFLEECRDLLPDRKLKAGTTVSTTAEDILTRLWGGDQDQLTSLLNWAWLDMTTRMVLPHLYEADPRPAAWMGVALSWLPSDATKTRLLSCSSLRALATHPSMLPIWKKIAASSEKTAQALRAVTARPQQTQISKAGDGTPTLPAQTPPSE